MPSRGLLDRKCADGSMGTDVVSRRSDRRTARRGHPLVALGVAAAVALATTGCGARWSDAQHEAVMSGARAGDRSELASSADGGSAGPSTTVASDATGDTASPAGDAGATTPASDATAASVPSGTRAAGTASGPPSAAAASGAAPCTAPSDAPGVTADTITVGNISTLSGPIPGLGATSVAATRGYIAYLNATGGVCGRKVELKTADDGQDNGRFRSLLTQMEPSVLGLVGQTGGGDAGGADIAEKTRIPVVAPAFSTQFQNASTVFDVNPPFADTSKSTGKYRYLYSQGVRKAAIVYIAVDQSRDQIDNTERPLMEAAGIKVVNYQPLPLSTLSYDSAARGVANSGADYLLFLGGYSQNSDMASSMYETGYDLKYAEYFTAYGTNFIDLAGPAAEGASSWSFSIPTEEASSQPEAARYVKWMQQVAPDASPDVFSAEAWAASKAFFDALTQLPGPISRDALIAQLQTFTDFDAGGFYGRIDLGDERNFGCYIGMHVVSGTWTRMAPAQGFLC